MNMDLPYINIITQQELYDHIEDDDFFFDTEILYLSKQMMETSSCSWQLNIMKE